MASARSKRCCVIGGAGFIGRAVVAELLKTGREVVVVDRQEKSPWEDPKVRYLQADYSNREFLEELLPQVSEVIHLAYASVPKTSFEDPFEDLLHNVPPALTLFEIAAAHHIKKLVFASTGGAVYGQAQQLPIAEHHPTNPIAPYGITKLAIEKYAHLFFTLKQLPVVVVRPSNAYGEGQRPFAGQGFIATAMASILEGKAITIFGKNGNTRDYIHVQDIATGIVAALEKGKPGECYNLGTGVGVDNKEIVDMVKELAEEDSYPVKVIHQPPRGFDVDRNVLDSSKLTKDTGWKPKLSLEEGLQRSWEYYRQSYQKNHGKKKS